MSSDVGEVMKGLENEAEPISQHNDKNLNFYKIHAQNIK